MIAKIVDQIYVTVVLNLLMISSHHIISAHVVVVTKVLSTTILSTTIVSAKEL
jgi:hypothetical protein